MSFSSGLILVREIRLLGIQPDMGAKGLHIGQELDGAMAQVNGIAKRLPYQTNDAIRKKINDGTIQYLDMHLSHTAQQSRYGFLGGKVDAVQDLATAVMQGKSLSLQHHPRPRYTAITWASRVT